MSPFLHADQIEAPLLLLHNQDDTNVGTHPMQSQRLYEAMNGLGKTVQLVEYPYEDHGPAARETVLDYWSRAIEWLDRYVKNAGPRRRRRRGPRPDGVCANETHDRRVAPQWRGPAVQSEAGNSTSRIAATCRLSTGTRSVAVLQTICQSSPKYS